MRPLNAIFAAGYHRQLKQLGAGRHFSLSLRKWAFHVASMGFLIHDSLKVIRFLIKQFALLRVSI